MGGLRAVNGGGRECSTVDSGRQNMEWRSMGGEEWGVVEGEVGEDVEWGGKSSEEERG